MQIWCIWCLVFKIRPPFEFKQIKFWQDVSVIKMFMFQITAVIYEIGQIVIKYCLDPHLELSFWVKNEFFFSSSALVCLLMQQLFVSGIMIGLPTLQIVQSFLHACLTDSPERQPAPLLWLLMRGKICFQYQELKRGPPPPLNHHTSEPYRTSNKKIVAGENPCISTNVRRVRL